MRNKFILGFSVLALTFLAPACKPTTADQYQFERKEYERLQPEITFVTHPSAYALVKAAPEETVKVTASAGRGLKAWSVLRGNKCEVHIVDPAVSYQPEWIGHEVTHCIYGRWHK